MKPKSKLVRNLKPGDKVTILDCTDTVRPPRTAVVTIASVREIRPGVFTGKRQWEATGDFPWWWGPKVITGYSDTRVDLTF